MDRNILKKIIITFVVYSLALLFIGRQMAFIPQVKFGSTKEIQSPDLRKNVLDKFLKEERGSYSIYYKNLVTKEEFGIDENKVQTAASLNKLPIVAYLYNKAAKKGIDLEEEITIQESDVQDYGTGSIRYEEPGGSYSLKTLTKLALEQSDNTAAYVLGIRLGRDEIQKYADSLGLSATNIEGNKTTAREMGQILELIYSGKITTKALTRELLDFMRDTDFEDRLARDLPGSIPIYHKAADGTGFVHDVGIIDPTSLGELRGASGGKNPFILSVLASEIDNVEEAKKTIGKIANFIYQEQQ